MSWDASFTFLIACSASLFSASGALAWGFTMAFLLWFTLIGLPPSIPPFSLKAMFIDLCSLNSTKANLVGWVSSPAMRTKLIFPHGSKYFITSSADSEVLRLPTYMVLRISSIFDGSTFPVSGGGGGITVPIADSTPTVDAGSGRMGRVAVGVGVGMGRGTMGAGATVTATGAVPNSPGVGRRAETD